MDVVKGGAVHEEPLLKSGKFQKSMDEKVRSTQSTDSLLSAS